MYRSGVDRLCRLWSAEVDQPQPRQTDLADVGPERMYRIIPSIEFPMKRWETVADQPRYAENSDALSEGIRSLKKWFNQAKTTSSGYFICMVWDPTIKGHEVLMARNKFSSRSFLDDEARNLNDMLKDPLTFNVFKMKIDSFEFYGKVNKKSPNKVRVFWRDSDTGIFNLSRTSHPQLTFFVMGNWASSRLEHYWFSGTHSALAHSKKPKTDPLKILEVHIKNLAPRGPAYSSSDSNEPIFRENGQELSSQEGFS
ncbi:hypothetical protein B0H11DRAFT_2203763 [Mycena galericulata]|nr:hypothetical protein B0H11DRAFT_2203763 [Mycena galericulata]